MSLDFEKYLKEILEISVKSGATDVHLCVGSKPLMRINGTLKPIEDKDKIMPDFMESVVRLYLNAFQMKKLDDDKYFDFSYSSANLGRFRCNVYLQRGTYAMAIRTLPLNIPTLDELGIPDIANEFLKLSRGLVLITGATGSGKSTTLASMVQNINNMYNYHISTIEDPVEYLHRHNKSMVTQKEIGSDARSFAEALRSTLREDPDVIMLGEMRDPDTISIALTAAETGHLVLSTLHTNGAVKAIDRILDSFPTSQLNQVKSQLATILEGVISQQLIPRKDGKGLVLATEILIVNPAIRNLIREGKHYQINNLIQNAGTSGMLSMERCVARLVKDDVISKEDAISRVSDSKLFETYLRQNI